MNIVRYQASLLICFFMAVSSANARLITGEGYGVDAKSARNEALTALASSIFVQIESNSEIYQNDEGESYFNSTTHASTDLPMIGVTFDCYKTHKQQFCTAGMETETALPIYQHKMQALQKDINHQLKQLPDMPIERHYSVLTELLTLYEAYEKLLVVTTYITGENKQAFAPAMTKQALKNKLSLLEESVNSMNLAARLLSRDITQSGIYVRPATLENSREITPFANALFAQLKQHINPVSEPKQASYFFNGSYRIHQQGIQVTYSLIDDSGQTIKTNLVELAPSSYQKYRIEPTALDFDKLLHKGYAISSDFRVQVNTNKGSRQLLFNSGETVEILIKLNRPGYFYMVGHSKTPAQELSYLLDLNEAQSDRKFIYYVNADDVNKWLSLGKFEASAPFGVESLQVIASETDPINDLPSYSFDPTSQYYVLSRSVTQGISKTRGSRGLKKLKQKGSKIAAEKTEAVLMFTTQR